MSLTIKHWLLTAAVRLPLISQAEPYFTTNEANLIWDKATGFIRQRCSVGMTWCVTSVNRNLLDQLQKRNW